MVHLLVALSLAAGAAEAVRAGITAPLAVAEAAPAQKPGVATQAPSAPSKIAEAYYQFMLGRYEESEGDMDAAIKAYQQAALLDPGSAEIQAELASLYARLSRAGDAIAAAEAALKLDPKNIEAHRTLGLVYAALARPGEGEVRPTATTGAYATQAIAHLEAAMQRADVASEPGLQVTLARLHMDASAFDKAIPLLSGLVAEDPEADEAVSMLADAYERSGKRDEAIKVLDQAGQREPKFYASLGELYERQRRWKDAADAYGKAAKLFPGNVELKVRLAIALLNDPDGNGAARARDLLGGALKASPGDGRTLYLMTQAQRLLKDLDGAEATARRLMSVQPGNLWGAEALAEVLADRREYRKVIDTLEPLVSEGSKKKPGDDSAARDLKPALLQLAFAYQEVGDFDRAIAAFERVRQLSPGEVTSDLYVIQANLAAHRLHATIELARAARLRHPDDARIVRLEADALRQSGRVDDGVSLLEAARKARPDDPTAHVALAELLTTAKRYPDAERVLRDASVRFPDDLSIPFQLGAVAERQKRNADAERLFRQVIGRDPRHALALNYLGYMLADRGERLDEAIGLIKRAVELDPYNGSYLDSLGWAYFKQGKLGPAEINLRRAAEQLPRNSVVQDHYGDLLFKLGRYGEAAAAWQRSLDGDGEEIERAEVERKLRTARDKAGTR
jgi:tetratricopeptide (TPR) repeat protein